MKYAFVTIEKSNPSVFAEAINFDTNQVVATQFPGESMQKFVTKVIKGHTDTGWKIEFIGLNEGLLIFRK